VAQCQARRMGSSPRSPGSSLAGHRSLRSSAGASLALPAWLRFLDSATWDRLAQGTLVFYVEE
jgi:hypothetical protein